MHDNCQECARLWSEYALATRHYLKLEGRLQIAGISRDQKSVQELTPMVQAAFDGRAEARRQIEEHERSGQASKASA